MSQDDRRPPERMGMWARLLLFAAVAAGAMLFLSAISSLVKLVVVSALLAYILDPLVVFIEARGVSRIGSTSLVFILLLAFASASLTLLVPAMSKEISALKSVISTGQANALIERSESFVNDKLGAIGAEKLDLLELWHSFVVDKVNKLLGYVLNAVSLITSLLLVPFIVFFLLTDGPAFRKRFVGIVPNRYFEFTLNLLYKMDMLLGNYLRGVFVESIIIGGLATAVLWAMDVKYFIVLGIVIGLTNIVPYFGPVVGAVPAILIALIDTGDTSFALYVAVGLTAVQILDNAALKPVLLARMVNIHPLAVLLVILVGGRLFGVFGMLLSVPATAVLKVGIVEAVANFRQYFGTHAAAATACKPDIPPGACKAV